jgi:hypothetical protein
MLAFCAVVVTASLAGLALCAQRARYRGRVLALRREVRTLRRQCRTQHEELRALHAKAEAIRAKLSGFSAN